MNLFEQAAHRYFDELVAEGIAQESQRQEWIDEYFRYLSLPAPEGSLLRRLTRDSRDFCGPLMHHPIHEPRR